MMCGFDIAFLILLKHREVNDPEEIILVVIKHSELTCDPSPEESERIVSDLGCSAYDEYDISFSSSALLKNCSEFFFTEVLSYR